jgi:ABC-2 type transport system permease protein
MNWWIVRLELRRSRTLIGWLVFTLVAYGGIMAIFYPRMRENGEEFSRLLTLWPKELLAAFGMTTETNLGDAGAFFNVYLGSLIWPIVAAIGAILLATRPTAADVERGWSEVSLATPVSRTGQLASAIAVQAVAMAILAVALVAGVLVVGALVGAGFDAGRFVLAAAVAFVYACAVAAVTTLLGATTLSRGVAGGLVAGALLGMYLLQAVSQIEPSVEWVKYLSAFHYYDATAIVDSGTVALGDVAVFGAVAALAWSLAAIVWRRRDVLP